MTDAVKPYTTLAELEFGIASIELQGYPGYRALTAGAYDRLLATAKAGMADTERLDWLEGRLNERGEVHAITWTHDGRHEINDGVILVHRMKNRGGVDETLRNTVDAFRRTRSGRASPNEETK